MKSITIGNIAIGDLVSFKNDPNEYKVTRVITDEKRLYAEDTKTKRVVYKSYYKITRLKREDVTLK